MQSEIGLTSNPLNWVIVRPDGIRVPIDRALVVGRLPDCDVVVADGLVSGRHLRVEPALNGVRIEDLGSSNGTFVDGVRMVAPHVLYADATLALGAAAIRIISPKPTPAVAASFIVVRSGAAAGLATEIVVGADLLIGRADECAVVLDDLLVSNQHLRVRRPVATGGGEILIEDLGSANGTLVDGEVLSPGTPTTVGHGTSLQLGDTQLVVSGTRTPPVQRRETVIRTVPAELRVAAAAATGAASASSAPSQASSGRRSRTPLLVGSAVITVLLVVGVVAFMATRGSSGTVESVVRNESPATVQIITDLSDGVASGSGVVIDANAGLVLTNAHVIAGGNSYKIRRTTDGKEVPAQLVASMPCDDLALLQITAESDRTGLSTAEFAEPGSLNQGESVVALGYPGSAESASSESAFASDQMSATNGIVSKTSAKYIDPLSGVAPLPDTVQHTAAINHGNSGGPLFDLDGKLVGINVAMFADSTGQRAEGENYAVSVEQIRKVIDGLKAGTSVGEFGMSLSWVGTKEDPDKPAALLIDSVAANSPASNAGIRVDTYVVAVDDKEIRDLIEYCAAVSTPGSHSITTSSDDTDSSRDWTLNAGVW